MKHAIAWLAGVSTAVALAAALVGPNVAGGATPTLIGTVGPGFTITLKDGSGKVVKALRPGKYMITVRDKASIHDFHLSGSGLNKVITSVGFVGSKTIAVTLRKGTYRYVCDPHSSIMHGSLKVG
jgi:plastocyanin